MNWDSKNRTLTFDVSTKDSGDESGATRTKQDVTISFGSESLEGPIVMAILAAALAVKCQNKELRSKGFDWRSANPTVKFDLVELYQSERGETDPVKAVEKGLAKMTSEDSAKLLKALCQKHGIKL